MSNRTPGLQARSQFHAYWGQYQYDTAGAPPPPFFGRAADIGSQKLPNAPGNPLILPYVGAGGQLEAGDTASTVELVPSNGDRWGLWVCIYPGTAGGGDAVWERCDNDMAAAQTIRDAHVIVVAQDGTLLSLSSVASPPNAVNNFNLSAGVGDVVSVTCDYLDSGNGAQLEQALLAAAASGNAIDIRLRPCALLVTGVLSLPLVLPGACRLIGAGGIGSVSQITGLDAGDQRVLQMESFSELIDLAIFSPQPVAATTGAGVRGVVFTGAFASVCRLKNCLITVANSAADAFTRNAPWAFWDQSASSQVLDCVFKVGSQRAAFVNTIPTTAIVMGNPILGGGGAPVETAPVQSFEIGRCHFAGFKIGQASGNRILLSYYVTGNFVGTMYDCQGQVSRPIGDVNFGAIGLVLPALLASGGPVSTLLPRLDNIRIIVEDFEVSGEGGDANYVGVCVSNATQEMVASLLTVRGVQVIFAKSVLSPVVPRLGLLVIAKNTAAIRGGSVAEFQTQNHTVGIQLTTSIAGSFIDRIRMGDCNVADPVTATTFGQGIVLDTDGSATIDAIGIANCVAVGAPVSGFGINIDNASISNTIVVGCNLTPGAGTALGDSGTNTEAGHNILA